jgi:hypothetical protein
MALELGFDAGFTIGARPSDVANFIYEKMIERLDKTETQPRTGKKKSGK